MNTNIEPLLEQLKKTTRCRPEIQRLAEEWGEMKAGHYDSLATLLTQKQEGKSLGILLNVAAYNKIVLEPQIWVSTLKILEDITDFLFPCQFQNATAIEPLLTIALADDISWERQAAAAQLATELTVKFDQPKQPAKKILWKLSKEIFSPRANALIHCSLAILEKDNTEESRSLWMSEMDITRALPKERPAVIIGGDYTVRRPIAKHGRNEPCHCGSSKKYKKCCHSKDQELLRDASRYEGLTRTQLNATPSIVEDSKRIEVMSLKELKKLSPGSLNDVQLDTAIKRVRHSGFLDFTYELLLELRQRPGKSDQAIEEMKDLFDSALSAANLTMADKLALLIPEKELYHDSASKLHHAILKSTANYDELEAICREAITEGELSTDHILMELSFAFGTILPAMSIIFGRAGIVSEPERVIDNDVLFDAIEKTRIDLDLEPWGDPIEDYQEWLYEKIDGDILNADKDQKIEDLKEQLSEVQGESTEALKSLQARERELETLERELKTNSANKQFKLSQEVQPSPNLSQRQHTGTTTEDRGQISTLKNKIGNLKNEIKSQQADRQDLRKQLQEARQELSAQKVQNRPPIPPEVQSEDAEANIILPHKVQIPEYSNKFRKSAENLPQSVVTKALRAATGFSTRDESVLKQTIVLEQLPGYLRIRVGIQHRLILRQTPDQQLIVEDIIPRKNLETWIRKHST